MCYYAERPYRLHYACVECRVSFKRHPPEPGSEHACPNCSGSLVCAGHDFAPPPRRDVRGWTVVAAVLAEGLRYEGREPCGCGKEPKFRPRTRAQLRARQRAAETSGVPLAATLGQVDPGLSAD